MSTLVLLLACAAPDSSQAWRDRQPPAGPDPAIEAAGAGPIAAKARQLEAIDTVVEREPQEVVRFVALGDAGEGNPKQYEVGDSMTRICAERGCDYAVYLGDNFYNNGIGEENDPQWDLKFELPYANLHIPFYVTLGNHDYGGNGSGYEFWKAPFYIEYTDISDKWVFPAQFFRVAGGVVDLWSLDTNAAVWGFFEDQSAWLQATVPASTATWKIAFAHHPYLSNGPHGNAGQYDGAPGSPIGDGEYVKELLDDGVCGKIDLFLCGHDHNRQWLVDTCQGTELVVSGAGSKTTPLSGENATYFEKSTEGFLWVEADATHLTGVFYDAEGNEEFERTIYK